MTYSYSIKNKMNILITLSDWHFPLHLHNAIAISLNCRSGGSNIAYSSTFGFSTNLILGTYLDHYFHLSIGHPCLTDSYPLCLQSLETYLHLLPVLITDLWGSLLFFCRHTVRAKTVWDGGYLVINKRNANNKRTMW